VSRGSTSANEWRSRSSLIPRFTPSCVTTAVCVTSDPVPLVVGTATSGATSPGSFPVPTYSPGWPPWARRTATTFA